MSLNADALQFLADKGLSIQDVVEFARIAETAGQHKVRSKGAERQARYMARKNAEIVTNDVSNDASQMTSQGSPIENNHTPPSSSQPSVSRKARAQSFPPPEGVSPDQWENLMACRKAKRAAMTNGAYFQICRKLEEGARQGWPPGELVNRAVESGWTTVFIPKELPNGRMVGNSGQGSGGREHPGLKLLREAEAELAAEAEREAQSRH